MPRYFIQLILAFFAGVCLQAAVFEDANRLYEQGKYPDAISLYQTLLKSGHHSPGVLFNLGNAYFKNGELGRAIFYFRCARQIAPRDPDIQANLRFARDRVSGGLSVPVSFFEQLLARFTVNELATLAAFLFWVLIALLSYARWRTSARPALRLYISASTMLFLGTETLVIVAWQYSRQQTAIITERQASVRLGPLDESQEAFTAPDGTELRVLARRDDWVQVSDKTDRTGWINVRAIALFPGQKSAASLDKKAGSPN